MTIAGQAPRNLYHFVFANGHYESSGNQPLPSNGRSDFVALAKAAGYPAALRCTTAEELDRALPRILATDGPVLIELAIARDDATPRWAGVPMAQMVRKLRTDLGVPEANAAPEAKVPA